MSKNSTSKPEAENWVLSRCSHGCLHLVLGRISVKLSPQELKSLVKVLGDAYIRLCVEEVTEAELESLTSVGSTN